MKILIINAGSSSLKYQLIDMTDESVLAKGIVERIGNEGSNLAHRFGGGLAVHQVDLDVVQLRMVGFAAPPRQRDDLVAAGEELLAEQTWPQRVGFIVELLVDHRIEAGREVAEGSAITT